MALRWAPSGAVCFLLAACSSSQISSGPQVVSTTGATVPPQSCFVGGPTNPFTFGDAGAARSDSPGSVQLPTAQATGRCIDDRDCPQGSRCNKALSPSSCELVRCGPEKSACSSDDVCQEGLRCHKNACKRCDVCGDQCEVDFQTDPNNCGACGVVAPKGVKCVGGELTCPDGLSLCGKGCVDLASDPRNCGECGHVVDTQADANNCGGCGKKCARAPGDKCKNAACDRVLKGGHNTCANICRLQGLECVVGGNHTGNGAPAPDACTVEYDTLYCECSYAPQ
jgi:hypothetical protein